MTAKLFRMMLLAAPSLTMIATQANAIVRDFKDFGPNCTIVCEGGTWSAGSKPGSSVCSSQKVTKSKGCPAFVKGFDPDPPIATRPRISPTN